MTLAAFTYLNINQLNWCCQYILLFSYLDMSKLKGGQTVGLWGGRKGTSGCEMPSAPKTFLKFSESRGTQQPGHLLFFIFTFSVDQFWPLLAVGSGGHGRIAEICIFCFSFNFSRCVGSHTRIKEFLCDLLFWILFAIFFFGIFVWPSVLGYLCSLLFWKHLFLVSLLITIELWHRSPGDPHKWRFGPLWTFICFSRHYTGPATAQENKTEHSSGTAVAKCLLLTALSFLPPNPRSYFKEAPAKKGISESYSFECSSS